MTLIDRSSAALIRFYQRWISPYKGFRCAFGVLHGAESCSEFALRTIEQGGWGRLWEAFPQRLDACRSAARLLRMRPANGTGDDQIRRQSRENPLVDGAAQVADGCCDVGCDLASAGDCSSIAECCTIDIF